MKLPKEVEVLLARLQTLCIDNADEAKAARAYDDFQTIVLSSYSYLPQSTEFWDAALYPILSSPPRGESIINTSITFLFFSLDPKTPLTPEVLSLASQYPYPLIAQRAAVHPGCPEEWSVYVALKYGIRK